MNRLFADNFSALQRLYGSATAGFASHLDYMPPGGHSLNRIKPPILRSERRHYG
jgi:hypothetical protein